MFYKQSPMLVITITQSLGESAEGDSLSLITITRFSPFLSLQFNRFDFPFGSDCR